MVRARITTDIMITATIATTTSSTSTIYHYSKVLNHHGELQSYTVLLLSSLPPDGVSVHLVFNYHKGILSTPTASTPPPLT